MILIFLYSILILEEFLWNSFFSWLLVSVRRYLHGTLLSSFLDLQDIQFSPRILEVYYITITFEDQKNGETFKKRTQQLTNDKLLCPVICFGRIILRILQFVPNTNKDTFICTTASSEVKTELITSEFTLKSIWWCCKTGGEEEEFGFSARSIRLGAVMALFLTNKHPTRIMLLGWWKSLAFLKYIRTQTLEWMLNMSELMTNFDHFEDLNFGGGHSKGPKDHWALWWQHLEKASNT